MNWLDKAIEIHEKSIVIDSHLDLGGIIFDNRKKDMTKVLENLFYDDFLKAGLSFVVAAIFIESQFLPESALKLAMLQIDAIYKDVEESADKFMVVKDSYEMEQAIRENKIGIILSLEGAEPIGRDLGILTMLYKLGVRGLGLTWSRRNFVADGSYFRDPEEGVRGGLTPFGIQVVRHAEKLGMFIDISHINDEGFFDVVKYSENPLIASHSNSRTINNITRNLNDDQIKEIGKNKGVIGVNGYKTIVSLKEDEQGVEKLCDHIEYLVSVAGEDSVGFGFDLCTKYYNNGKIYDVIDDHSQTILISEELLKRGVSETVVEKIIGRNFYNYLQNMLKK